MRQVFEGLRLAYDQGRSQRAVARALGLAQSTVNDYLRRCRGSGLAWPIPTELDAAAVEARLYVDLEPPTGERPASDWAAMQAELKRKGVTLQLLWIEDQAARAVGLSVHPVLPAPSRLPRDARASAPPGARGRRAGLRRLRRAHHAGRGCDDGEIRTAQVFVAALGASHLIDAEATWTQSLPDWIGSHVRMLEYLGGVPALIVPDNLEAGVTSPCCYEPVVHPTYQDVATHCGTAILPARVRHPRDKAKVETAVQIVEREILAPLRHDVFSSLAELQHAIRHACDRLNERPFQKLAGSRRSVFE